MLRNNQYKSQDCIQIDQTNRGKHTHACENYAIIFVFFFRQEFFLTKIFVPLSLIPMEQW